MLENGRLGRNKHLMTARGNLTMVEGHRSCLESNPPEYQQPRISTEQSHYVPIVLDSYAPVAVA